MIFTETSLAGAFIIDPERKEDERGYFARIWCEREFEARGLDSRLVQCSASFNRGAGTLRGMHYQVAPYEETKLVRCTRGTVFDVIIDLRPTSPTLGRHVGATLSAANGKMMYVPRGFAHGFQTLEDDTEIAYQMSEFYRPECARGVRWNDPAFGIAWPRTGNLIINARDQAYADFRPRPSSQTEE